MSLSELMSWKDVRRCVLAAIVMTLVFCGIPYVAAGGPLPSMTMMATASSHPITAKKMQHAVTYRNIAQSAAPTPVVAAVAAWPKAYHVLPGDSLSVIAGKMYHNPSAWTVIYWANHQQIRYANVILVSQNLTIPALPTVIPAGPRVVAPPLPPRTTTLASSVRKASVKPKYTPPARASYTAAAAVTVSIGGSGFQACVIARESGGNPNIWNASGHYGLYQFSASTWAAHGGNPADFGHASVAEQNQIFYNTVAADGHSDWSPYDGC